MVLWKETAFPILPSHWKSGWLKTQSIQKACLDVSVELRCMTNRQLGKTINTQLWFWHSTWTVWITRFHLSALKTGFNGNFLSWQCKRDYWIRALLQLEKKNICARLIDDFDAERYCDRNCREPTWRQLWRHLVDTHGSTRYSAMHSEFAVGKSPRRTADWANRVLFR